jgi:hypothetical protein
VRIFKNKAFNKWAKGECLDDQCLFDAAWEVAEGNVEASLGQKVFKKRIALEGRGKRGGSRTIVAFQQGSHLFYILGFAKNERSTVKNKELKDLQDLAKVYFALTDKQLDEAVKARKLFEVKNNER